MKKSVFIAAMVFSLILSLSGCSQQVLGADEVFAYSGDIGAAEFSNNESDTAADIFGSSDTIISAKVCEINEFTATAWEYVFEVENVYFGDVAVGDKVYVYDELSPEAIDINAMYYLALNGHEDSAYPHTIYARNHKSFLPRLLDNRLEFLNGNAYELSSKTNLDAFLKELTQKDAYIDKATATDSKDFDSLSSAARAADKVLLVRITEKTPVNPYISSYKVEVVSALKGETDKEEFSLSYSSGFDKGDELLYLANDDVENDITYSSKYGIVSAKSEAAREIIDARTTALYEAMTLTCAEVELDNAEFPVSDEYIPKILALFDKREMEAVDVFPESIFYYTIHYGQDNYSVDGTENTQVCAIIDGSSYLFKLTRDELTELYGYIAATMNQGWGGRDS